MHGAPARSAPGSEDAACVCVGVSYFHAFGELRVTARGEVRGGWWDSSSA